MWTLNKIYLSLYLVLSLSLSGEALSKSRPYAAKKPLISEELAKARLESDKKFDEYAKRLKNYELVKKNK